MNTYQFELLATCPNGALADRYDCTVQSAEIIQVEKINELRNRLATAKRYQEDLADDIRNALQARVVLVGWHWGVKVTCVRE